MAIAPDRSDVVVLGAGPAGLAAAWFAVRRGFSVTVIDRADHVGGLAASLVVDGQSVDLGSHRLHPSIRPDILRDLNGLPGLDLQWRPRNGRIRLGGRWLAFPLRTADLLRNASPPFAGRVLADIATSAIRRRLHRRAGGSSGPSSFTAAVRLHLGPTISRSFYEPYARKLWDVDGTRLSSELFRRRISAGSAAAILRKALRRGAPPGFWYPAHRFGAICSSLADDIVRRGGDVRTATQVTAVRLSGDDVEVRLAGGRSIVGRTLVSTVPTAALLAMIAAPPEVTAAADQLEFRAALLVYLTVPRDRYTAFDAHYFPELTTVISRLSEPKSYRTSTADPTEQTVVCAEVPATIGDDLWMSEDDVMIERVRRELCAQGLPDPTPTNGRVERRSHVYPVYRTGFESSRDIVETYLRCQPNLAVLGRQALFAHDNTHHALLMGKSVVDTLDDHARIDRRRWDDALRSFDSHVVED